MLMKQVRKPERGRKARRLVVQDLRVWLYKEYGGYYRKIVVAV